MAFALPLDVPAHLAPPALDAPAPREASFGRIEGRVGAGTDRVVVLVDGRAKGEQRVRAGRRFALQVTLPPRDAAVRVVALDALGNRASATVRPVLGLPPSATPQATRPHEDPVLARKLRRLVDAFPGIAAVYVENLVTGAGAAANARARFPAASTVKLPIAIEVLRVLRGRPPPGSRIHALLQRMLVRSDNEAANELLAWIGGSQAGGAARMTATMEALGLRDTRMYGGFLTASRGRPIPLTVEREPPVVGKHTTAADLARLHRLVHAAAAGRGALVRTLDGSFSSEDARLLVYLLAHSADRGKLDRHLPDDAVVPHKGGWVTEARHDSGVVYTADGVFVAAVMTWTYGEAGDSSDELAGRVAKAALERFRTAPRAPVRPLRPSAFPA
jgi:beta-lactamase class A